jgi:hypothetical protein
MFKSDLLHRGYDVTTLHVQSSHYYNIAPEDIDQVRSGDFMVLDPRAYWQVRRCTGAAGELFAGIVLDKTPFSLILGCGGFLQVMTLMYDADAIWTMTNDCLVVLGPGGIVTRGKYPQDYHEAIGRVWALPGPDQPALGVSVMAWG